MPSRRTLLHTVSAATGGLFAGCTSFTRGVEGYVQLKSVAGVSTDDGHRVEESIIRVSLSSPPGTDVPRVSHLDDEWADRFDTLHEPLVSDALYDDLRRAYDGVEFVVGVCSPSWADDDDESVGCYNVSTTRENFNGVHVHDKVTASSDGTSLTIHSRDGTWSFNSE